jgi:hypothetical protein
MENELTLEKNQLYQYSFAEMGQEMAQLEESIVIISII